MVSLRCCAMQFRKWRASLRVITVFIFLAIFAYDANWNVLTFSRTSGVPVTPWVYPAVFSARYLMMCICLAVMVLFCDAPFLDRHQPYLILRSGRGHWALGTAGYLLASSVVVSASIFLMGMLLGMDTLTFSTGWGSVLQSVAGKSIIPTRILALYSPLAACGLALLLSSLIFCFLGLLFFLCNLLAPPVVGTLAVGAFCVLDFFSLFFLHDAPWLLHLSPVSWANLNQLGTTGWPTVTYALSMLVGLNGVLLCLIVLRCRRMDIQVTHSEMGR